MLRNATASITPQISSRPPAQGVRSRRLRARITDHLHRAPASAGRSRDVALAEIGSSRERGQVHGRGYRPVERFQRKRQSPCAWPLRCARSRRASPREPWRRLELPLCASRWRRARTRPSAAKKSTPFINVPLATPPCRPQCAGRWRVRGGLHCHRRALAESAVEDDHLAGHRELIKIHRESTPTRER
jgi:hypothetical protein